MKQYCYGMRLRPFDIGCQPSRGLVGRVGWMNPDEKSKYYDMIWYDRKLSDKEVEHYSLDLVKVLNLIDPENREIPEEARMMDM